MIMLPLITSQWITSQCLLSFILVSVPLQLPYAENDVSIGMVPDWNNADANQLMLHAECLDGLLSKIDIAVNQEGYDNECIDLYYRNVPESRFGFGF